MHKALRMTNFRRGANRWKVKPTLREAAAWLAGRASCSCEQPSNFCHGKKAHTAGLCVRVRRRAGRAPSRAWGARWERECCSDAALFVGPPGPPRAPDAGLQASDAPPLRLGSDRKSVRCKKELIWFDSGSWCGQIAEGDRKPHSLKKQTKKEKKLESTNEVLSSRDAKLSGNRRRPSPRMEL